MVLDLETGGKRPEGKIVEVGAVCVDEDLRTAGEFEMMVDGRPMEQEATDVNGITDGMLAGKPKWHECFQGFVDWCDSFRPYTFGAWAIDFDLAVLRDEYHRMKRRYPHPGHAFDVKTAVWLECMRSGFPARKLTVEDACRIMGIRFEGERHRALPDARMEAKLFVAAVSGRVRV